MSAENRDIRGLFSNNRAWAARMRERDPGFFRKLSGQQTPRYLWIGCSDSRVPANEIVDMPPGKMFVHRNIANQVMHTDLNCLSVLQFAVDLLKVEHIIVCGHYCCSGVRVALEGDSVGLSDNWLRNLRDVRARHGDVISPQGGEDALNRLCELNVIEQVMNVAHTTVVQEAWARGQAVEVHGWVYGLRDGLLKDLHMSVSGTATLEQSYSEALNRLRHLP